MAINGNQRQSTAINGNQWQSMAIQGEEVLTGPHLDGLNDGGRRQVDAFIRIPHVDREAAELIARKEDRLARQQVRARQEVLCGRHDDGAVARRDEVGADSEERE